MPSAAPPARSEKPPSAPDFHVIGLGASAGGVEALQQFFQGLTSPCGMAFVVIQHRDPRHTGKLVEILQRFTDMPVHQVDDKMPVAPDHVYVNPPDKDLCIVRGVLVPQARAQLPDHQLPIDSFLRSLAADLKERSVGVILSGMGSDGTMGLGAIKEVAGSIFVQDPGTAQFDGMPCSAIATGLADVIAPASTLAARVVAYCNARAQHGSAPAAAVQASDQAELESILVLLRAQTGQDFSLYKKSTLYRRIERRMALHQLRSIADYQRYLRKNKQEAELLLKDLLIGVTRFFRDAEVWQQLKAQGIPALLAAHPEGATLRAWTPACSTGEEAYSLAMVFQETVAQLDPGAHYELQVFATDLDGQAIDTARAAIYPSNISADVSEDRLNRFFVRSGNGYRVAPGIREMVVFAQQNLVMDPPFTKLDLLSCRNLLIYMESELQHKLLPLFHYCLKPHGILVLGSAESIGDAATLYSEVAAKARIYQRRNVAAITGPIEFPPLFSRSRKGVEPLGIPPGVTEHRVPDLQLLTNELLLQRFAPAAVLTTGQGEIVYLCGKAGRYLEPAAGRASMSLFSMAREGLCGALREVFFKAVRDQATAVLRCVMVSTGADSIPVDVTVQPLAGPRALAGMVLVVFSDSATPAPDADARAPTMDVAVDVRIAAMARELEQLRAELQNSGEEMQTAQEELKSTNEELQSTNEELQSSNEELTTSNEEIQSINEELQSVNRELAAKVQEISKAHEEEINLLNSTGIATVVLDESLCIRRFTTQATEIFKLIPGDIGRPITDLGTSLESPALETTAREVLRTLVSKEVLVRSQGKRWYLVRTLPYRTRDNRIDGVVITFLEATAEQSLQAHLQKILERVQGPDDTPQGTLSEVRELLTQTLSHAATEPV